MLESTLSLWTSITTWLTPAVLFLLLNLMIGTIAVTSAFSKPHNHRVNHHSMTVNHHHQQPPQIHTQLSRSPSVIQRLKSLSFYHLHHQPPAFLEPEHHQHVPDVPPAAVAQEVVHEAGRTLEEVFSKIVKKGNYGRQNSDTKPTGGELLVPLPRKIIKKCVTDKSAFAHLETTTTTDDNADAAVVPLPPPPLPPIGGGGVDEMADDFINRFR